MLHGVFETFNHKYTRQLGALQAMTFCIGSLAMDNMVVESPRQKSMGLYWPLLFCLRLAATNLQGCNKVGACICLGVLKNPQIFGPELYCE